MSNQVVVQSKSGTCRTQITLTLYSFLVSGTSLKHFRSSDVIEGTVVIDVGGTDIKWMGSWRRTGNPMVAVLGLLGRNKCQGRCRINSAETWQNQVLLMVHV